MKKVEILGGTLSIWFIFGIIILIHEGYSLSNSSNESGGEQPCSDGQSEEEGKLSLGYIEGGNWKKGGSLV